MSVSVITTINYCCIHKYFTITISVFTTTTSASIIATTTATLTVPLLLIPPLLLLLPPPTPIHRSSMTKEAGRVNVMFPPSNFWRLNLIPWVATTSLRGAGYSTRVAWPLAPVLLLQVPVYRYTRPRESPWGGWWRERERGRGRSTREGERRSWLRVIRSSSSRMHRVGREKMGSRPRFE